MNYSGSSGSVSSFHSEDEVGSDMYRRGGGGGSRRAMEGLDGGDREGDAPDLSRWLSSRSSRSSGGGGANRDESDSTFSLASRSSSSDDDDGGGGGEDPFHTPPLSSRLTGNNTDVAASSRSHTYSSHPAGAGPTPTVAGLTTMPGSHRLSPPDANLSITPPRPSPPHRRPRGLAKQPSLSDLIQARVVGLDRGAFYDEATQTMTQTPSLADLMVRRCGTCVV